MYLFFDTETTGLPKFGCGKRYDPSNWPRLVEVGWILSEEDGTVEEKSTYIIKPKNFKIPQDAIKIHGITTEIALKSGNDLKPVLIEFQELLKKSDYLIAHNIVMTP